MLKEKKNICWITPDYFLQVDSNIVPSLSDDFNIRWIIINTKDSKRKSDLQVSDKLRSEQFNLKYKQRDPRIIFQFVQFVKDIRKGNYDLIYISFHGLPFFFPIFFSLINSNKVIYGTHNVNTPKGASNEKLMRLYHKYAYNRFKNYQVFSKYQLEVIKELIPNKRYYYAPLALNKYVKSNITPSKEVIRFLFFGYIREYKRLDLLLRSFQKLYNSGVINIELHIAGNCQNWNQYESLISEGSPIITRIENIPESDIPDLISSCHYMVLPYQDSTQSGVITLAYQYNKPVIVSDIESFKQFVVDGSTGFTFKSESEESLINVIKQVVANHNNNYKNLTNSVKLFVENELATEKIVEMYREFLIDCMNNESQ